MSKGIDSIRGIARETFQCMYYIKLPFAEDLRDFEFENLDTTKKNQPTDEQLKAIDNLITSMDLTHADRG